MLAQTSCKHFDEKFCRLETENFELNANKVNVADDLKVTKKVIVHIYKFELTRLYFSREILLVLLYEMVIVKFYFCFKSLLLELFCSDTRRLLVATKVLALFELNQHSKNPNCIYLICVFVYLVWCY